MRVRALPALLGILCAAGLAGQASPPAVKTKPPRAVGASRAKAPIDFSGVWELDAAASQNVSRPMEGAVLSVKQNGNRIWIEPIEQTGRRILAEQIVVDGRLYEKRVGIQKGTLVAKWGKDSSSLWLEAVAGTDDNPEGLLERMVWRMQDFGNTWTRQSWATQGTNVKQTFLVFHRRGKWPTPSAKPPAAPNPNSTPNPGP